MVSLPIAVESDGGVEPVEPELDPESWTGVVLVDGVPAPELAPGVESPDGGLVPPPPLTGVVLDELPPEDELPPPPLVTGVWLAGGELPESFGAGLEDEPPPPQATNKVLATKTVHARMRMKTLLFVMDRSGAET